MKKEKQNQKSVVPKEQNSKKIKNPFAESKEMEKGASIETRIGSNWKNKFKFKKKTILFAAVFLIVAGLLGTSGYFYYQYKKATVSDAAKDEVIGYVAKIGKFMILPTDEVPTLATVADKDKLSSQPFFANAQNGDKVLFYTKVQEAILYRPSENKIVKAASMAGAIPSASSQAAPISSDAQPTVQDQPQQTPAPDQQASAQSTDPSPPQDQSATPVTVVVYNGTKINGLAATLAEELSSMSEVIVISKTNAEGDYSDNIIIDLDGNHSEEAQKIAQTLSGSVGTLPEGEKRPANADILVIGGKE